nr:hypothetical protein [Tanacetum cinerariifolium]
SKYWGVLRMLMIDLRLILLGEFNSDFHPMVDFIAASPLRARIAQSSTLPAIADEPASPVRDVSQGEACPTDSGFIADQDRATIAKSSTLPHDSALRVTSPAKGSMQHNISELTTLCTSLQRQYSELLAKFQAQKEEIDKLKDRVKVLEDKEDVVVTQSRDNAPIKGRSVNEGEAVAERISNDSEEVARVLTSMDAATALAGGIDVPTGSGFIPTAGPPATVISTGSEVGPTASLIVTRRKGKEVMVESDTPKKKKLQEHIDAQVARELEKQQEKENMRMNEQIARDAEVARIHVEEELQGMIDSLDKSNEAIAKYLQEYQDFALELPLEKRIEMISDLVKYQDNYSKVYKFQSQQRRPMTKKQKREYYMAVIKSNLGWRFKDFKDLLKQLDMEDLNQLWALVKEYVSIRPATSDKEMELWVELKRMYELDPEDQLWTLTQNFMHAPVEWKLYDLSGVHHVTAKDKEIFMLVEKDYPLRRGLKDATSVRRPLSRGSSSKNSVFSHTKSHSTDVEVHVKSNKKTNVASKKNVVQNKKNVTNVYVKNAPKVKDVLCVSCAKNVLIPCHDSCLAKYKLNMHSNVRRALFTTPRTATPKSLDTTFVVIKNRFVVVTPLSAKPKDSNAFRSTALFVQNKKDYETIHVKFDELMPMDSKHNCLEPIINSFQDNDSLAKDTPIPIKEDLDNLFSPMFEEYFKKTPSKVSTNSSTQTTLNNQDTPSLSSIIIEDNEAPPLVSSSEEQILPNSVDDANELNQEDKSAKF